MLESPPEQATVGQKVFVSYSRADRQRVIGLASLLEAMGHEVFMDQRSILPGRRWKAELEKALASSAVLMVFWTRHAARSQWVRREYETFDESFPERLLVPVLGDTTALPKTLRAHQHADFCPLINELLATVRELEEQGLGKRKIRAAVLKRLEEEGIELPRDKRNRVLGLLGVLNIGLLPLHALQVRSDAVAERIAAISPAHYVSAGIAASAGFATCMVLPGGGDPLATPDLTRVPVHVEQSGNAACDKQGLICVSMSRARVNDPKGLFFGHSTPPCTAEVIRRPSCKQGISDTDFALRGVVIRRSKDAEEGAQDISGISHFCLGSDAGKQGRYESANCVTP